jgi:hypothetical protein
MPSLHAAPSGVAHQIEEDRLILSLHRSRTCCRALGHPGSVLKIYPTLAKHISVDVDCWLRRTVRRSSVGGRLFRLIPTSATKLVITLESGPQELPIETYRLRRAR